MQKISIIAQFSLDTLIKYLILPQLVVRNCKLKNPAIGLEVFGTLLKNQILD